MRTLTYTLLGDGTSDKALLPIIDWTIRQYQPDLLLRSQWADFSYLPSPPKNLTERIIKAIELYPCHFLVIHRDAEKQSPDYRHQEIAEAWNPLKNTYAFKRVVGVVPIRMTEAWLLFDPSAIRWAASNPSGKEPLALPPLHTLETLSNPKEILHRLLREASELTGRRLQKFKVSHAVHRVADTIQDFSPLKYLSAYQAFEVAVRAVIDQK